MRTSDWTSILDATFLLVGEHSTLQWKDEEVEYAMFLDYYFNKPPYDLGERSRYSEASNIFTYLREMTDGLCTPERVHGTLICNTSLERPPKGKHMLIPARYGENGAKRVRKVLEDNPTIKYIFVMGMLPNYYLQKHGIYSSGEHSEAFLKGAEPSRIGLAEGYYKPVNAKPFRDICFKPFKMIGNEEIEIIPILPHKSYPLYDSNLKNFGESFNNLIEYFKNKQ